MNFFEIIDIALTDNSDIIFLNCKTKEDVMRITQKARNLPQEQTKDNPRLVSYIDRCAMKRHKAFLNVAKTIRENSKFSVQTSVRTGKNNFLVRTRPKGTETPWSEIAPIQIRQELPQFEVGRYKDIVNPYKNSQEEDEEDKPIENLDKLAKYITEQNEQEVENTNDNKRERSTDDISQGRTKNPGMIQIKL